MCANIFHRIYRCFAFCSQRKQKKKSTDINKQTKFSQTKWSNDWIWHSVHTNSIKYFLLIMSSLYLRMLLFRFCHEFKYAPRCSARGDITGFWCLSTYIYILSNLIHNNFDAYKQKHRKKRFFFGFFFW